MTTSANLLANVLQRFTFGADSLPAFGRALWLGRFFNRFFLLDALSIRLFHRTLRMNAASRVAGFAAHWATIRGSSWDQGFLRHRAHVSLKIIPSSDEFIRRFHGVGSRPNRFLSGKPKTLEIMLDQVICFTRCRALRPLRCFRFRVESPSRRLLSAVVSARRGEDSRDDFCFVPVRRCELADGRRRL